MEATKASSFEGWAVVEMFGHTKEVGFVTTECFGQAVLFRVDVPELPEREYELDRPAYAVTENNNVERWTAAGAKVKRRAEPARTRLIGPGAVYSILPCTEQAARVAIEKMIARPLILLELPKQEPLKVLMPGETEEPAAELEGACPECGLLPEDGHDDNCSHATGEDE